MPTCAVVHCHNGSGRKERTHEDGRKATLYQVQEGMQKQWQEVINRQNFVVNKNTQVCSLHFEDDAYVDETENHDKYNRKRKRKKLKPRALPTLGLRPIKPESETESRRKLKRANEITVIPNKQLKYSHLAEHSYAPFVEESSELDDTLVSSNLQESDDNPKPSTSSETPTLILVNNEDLLPVSENQIPDFPTVEDCKFILFF